MKSMSSFVFTSSITSVATVTHAAQLKVVPDATSYSPGAAISLTVTGTIDPTSEAAWGIRVLLGFTNSSFVSSTAEGLKNPPPRFGPQSNWACCGGEGSAVNNFNGVDSAFVTATVLFTAGSPGTASFDFDAFNDFFDVQGASLGTTVNIVPEPGTAALMRLGLLGLAAAGRPRR